MAGNYFKNAKFLEFFKRFATTELQQHCVNFNKISAEEPSNKSIQKASSFWKYIGWNYYGRQLQKTVGRLVEGIETGLQELGRKVPATGRRSLRQAKRNVMQLMADSRKRIYRWEKEYTRLRDMLPSRETTKVKFQSHQQFSIDSVSMMEEGKIGETTGEANCNLRSGANDQLSQYNRDTTLVHEPRYVGNKIASVNAIQTTADLHNADDVATVSLRNQQILRLAGDSRKLDSAVSLRTPDADVPRALMLTAKRNEEMLNSPQHQPVVNKSSY